MTTVIAGCVQCRRLIVRGADGDPWREYRRGGLQLPGDAVRCPADGGPHEAPGRPLLTTQPADHPVPLEGQPHDHAP